MKKNKKNTLKKSNFGQSIHSISLIKELLSNAPPVILTYESPVTFTYDLPPPEIDPKEVSNNKKILIDILKKSKKDNKLIL